MRYWKTKRYGRSKIIVTYLRKRHWFSRFEYYSVKGWKQSTVRKKMDHWVEISEDDMFSFRALEPGAVGVESLNLELN